MSFWFVWLNNNVNGLAQWCYVGLVFSDLIFAGFVCVIAFVLVSDVFGVLHAADFAVVES